MKFDLNQIKFTAEKKIELCTKFDCNQIDLIQIKFAMGKIELCTKFDCNQIDLIQIKIYFLRTK